MKDKKGVSPVIATILLIAIVIILALIIFLWARGFIKESVQKQGKPADQACSEIDLELSYIGEELQITNRGNVHVYKLEIQKKSGGSVEKQSFNKSVRIGQSVSEEVGSYDEIEVLPLILGQGENSKKIYTCKNSFKVK